MRNDLVPATDTATGERARPISKKPTGPPRRRAIVGSSKACVSVDEPHAG